MDGPKESIEYENIERTEENETSLNLTIDLKN